MCKDAICSSRSLFACTGFYALCAGLSFGSSLLTNLTLRPFEQAADVVGMEDDNKYRCDHRIQHLGQAYACKKVGMGETNYVEGNTAHQGCQITDDRTKRDITRDTNGDHTRTDT